VLEDYGRAGREQIMEKHATTHGREQVAAAIEEIDSARQRGLMLSVRPRETVLPSHEDIQKLIAEKREQLILNVTEDCNFRCSYCLYGGGYEHYRTHSGRTMSWETARAAIDDFLEHCRLSKNPVISFYGGEPLLNFELIRRCVVYGREQTQGRDVRFSLTTNGSLLSGEVAKFLADEGFLVLVSLDGPAAIHDRSRRTRGDEPTWRRVFSNLERFLEDYPDYRSNGRLRFNAVATPQSDLCEAERFWASCGMFTGTMGLEISEQKMPGVSLPVQPDDPLVASARKLRKEFVEGHKSGRFARDYGQASRWVQSALFQKQLLVFHKRGYLSPHLPEKMVFLNTCVPGARRTFVSADGGYYACERVVHSPAQLIGDIAGGVDTGKVLALLEKWMNATGEQCRFCWCVSHCMAGCLAMVEGDGGITEEAKARLCAMHRRATHQLLMEYCGILEENHDAFDYMSEFELS